MNSDEQDAIIKAATEKIKRDGVDPRVFEGMTQEDKDFMIQVLTQADRREKKKAHTPLARLMNELLKKRVDKN